MIIRCPHCNKEFDKPSRRNQHVRDAHKTEKENPKFPKTAQEGSISKVIPEKFEVFIE